MDKFRWEWTNFCAKPNLIRRKFRDEGRMNKLKNNQNQSFPFVQIGARSVRRLMMGGIFGLPIFFVLFNDGRCTFFHSCYEFFFDHSWWPFRFWLDNNDIHDNLHIHTPQSSYQSRNTWRIYVVICMMHKSLLLGDKHMKLCPDDICQMLPNKKTKSSQKGRANKFDEMGRK